MNTTGAFLCCFCLIASPQSLTVNTVATATLGNCVNHATLFRKNEQVVLLVL